LKIRMGFVSNSSSSSFCVIGKLIDEDMIYHGEYKWNDNIIMIGGSNGDGILVQHLSKARYDILSGAIETPKCKGSVTFIKGTFYEDGNNLGTHPKGSKVYCGECTINEIESDEEFKRAYVFGEDMDF
jgi:hypothetical protein